MAQHHLERVACERDYYRSVCIKSREQLIEVGISELTCHFAGTVAPCSHDIVLHLSFDFAQQVSNNNSNNNCNSIFSRSTTHPTPTNQVRYIS